jgi:hypothetical protein
MSFPDSPRRYVREVPEPNFEPFPSMPMPEPIPLRPEVPMPAENPVEVPVPA